MGGQGLKATEVVFRLVGALEAAVGKANLRLAAEVSRFPPVRRRLQLFRKTNAAAPRAMMELRGWECGGRGHVNCS